MRGLLASIAAVTLAGGAPATPVSSFDHGPLDRVLAAVVVGDSVDYARLRDDHLASLDAYLDSMAFVDPAGLDGDGRLAFYINLYNATVLSAVAHRYEAGYSVSEDDFAIFDESLVRVSGKRATLNDLEHRLIRREFHDPRVHAALVCAARSCPPLRDRAYDGKTLSADLDGRMRGFLRDPSRNTIDSAGRRLELSAIFDWYAEDFGGRENLARWVDRYVEPDVSSFEVRFRPYSWELNDVDR